jgi:hypothetical protein
MNWVKNIIESGAKNSDDATSDTLSAGTEPVVVPAKGKVAARQEKSAAVKEQPKPKVQVKQKSLTSKPAVQAKPAKQKTAAPVVPQHKPPGTVNISQRKKPEMAKGKTKPVMEKKDDKDKKKTPKYIYQ